MKLNTRGGVTVLAVAVLAVAVLALTAAALAFPALAGAHARVSPAVSVVNKLQLYSLVVPTEKSGVSTTRVVMMVPSGFGVDSFVPPPAPWRAQLAQTGSGGSAVITLTGGRTPTGQDTLFQFLAQPSSTGTYTFQIEQTYSDGSVVNWSGPESSDSPAPTIDVAGSLGGSGGISTLSIVALIVGGLGLLAGAFALVTGSRGRTLA